MAKKESTTPSPSPAPPRTRASIPPLNWTKFAVTWTGMPNTKLCSSVPADPEIVKAWTDARKPRVQPPGSKTLAEINEEVLNSLAEASEEEARGGEASMLVFQRHADHCVMRAGTIKAHIKDCGRRISAAVGKIEGEKAFSTKVINYLYPDPNVYWVPVLRPDTTPITKHDGEMDRPVTTRYGTALKRFEWIEPWRIDFVLWVLTASGVPMVQLADLQSLFMYGGVHGYAGERGNGEGKYLYTVTLIEEAKE